MGISEQTFYRWNMQYGSLEPGQARELKRLQKENARLKKLVADLSLDKAILQDIAAKDGPARAEGAGPGLCPGHLRHQSASGLPTGSGVAKHDLEVRHHCTSARIVYDLFHVVAKYGREVITRVRVDAANKLRQDKPARRVVKQAHWLLLRNRSSLNDAQQVRLDEVLAANQPLMTTYVMNEQLKGLWTAPDAWEWRRRWKQWLAHAHDSGIPALQRASREPCAPTGEPSSPASAGPCTPAS